MKGIRLHAALTKEQIGSSKQYGKGRNVELIKERNSCLLYRYYYYSKLARLRYCDLIKLLSSEFYLSERTIITIITENSIALKKIFAEATTSKTLQQKFTYLNWKI